MSLSTPYQWASSHFNIESVGWTAAIYTVYRVLKFICQAVVSAVRGQERVLKAEQTLNLLSTDQIPSLLEEIKELNKKQDRTNELLAVLIQKMDGYEE